MTRDWAALYVRWRCEAHPVLAPHRADLVEAVRRVARPRQMGPGKELREVVRVCCARQVARLLERHGEIVRVSEERVGVTMRGRGAQ